MFSTWRATCSFTHCIFINRYRTPTAEHSPQHTCTNDVCMYTSESTDRSEDEVDVSLQQLHQSISLTGLHQIHPLTVGPLVLTKVLCGDTAHTCTCTYIPQQDIIGKDRDTCTCISSWLAPISVVYSQSARLSAVTYMYTRPENNPTLNTISIY